MDLPACERPQFLDLLHIVEERERLPQLVHGVRRNALRVAVLIKTLEALVGEAAYLDRQTVTCSLTLFKLKPLAGEIIAPLNRGLDYR